MFVLFAVIALLRGWYKTANVHSARAKHAHSPGQAFWVGEISKELATRLRYYRRGDARLYYLATGTRGRMA